MLCAATEMNFTLLLNKVGFLYLLNIVAVFLIIAPMKLWKLSLTQML